MSKHVRSTADQDGNLTLSQLHLVPGDIVTVTPTRLRVTYKQWSHPYHLDIGLPGGFLATLESLIRAVECGEDEMVYVIPQENKEQAG